MTNMKTDTFGEWLRIERKRAGMSQEGLARKAGLGRTYIIKLERGGVVLPTRETRDRLHAVLGTSEQQLWSEVSREEAEATQDRAHLGARLDVELRGLTPRQRAPLIRIVEDVIAMARTLKLANDGEVLDEEAKRPTASKR